VLGRGHCSRIDVHVRVNLDSRDLETGRLEQETRARGDNALADTAAASVSRQTHLAVELFPLSTRLPCQKEGHLRDDTSSNENVFDHGEEQQSTRDRSESHLDIRRRHVCGAVKHKSSASASSSGCGRGLRQARAAVCQGETGYGEAGYERADRRSWRSLPTAGGGGAAEERGRLVI
jgi:hypothetical protein